MSVENPPAVDADVTVYYVSERSESVVSRTGRLAKEAVTASDHTVGFLVEPDTTSRVTLINYDTGAVFSRSRGRTTYLGQVERLEIAE
ncbi:hypothetical protein ACFQH3_16815 [Haladaptatus sp. GCM10025707]|uniref:hypothetical protein n=1 Tax=unclassified Haladaptatus TaxID=2622732 RepID=UPI0023E8A004|nr:MULTISPECIES: hypothetical protein [unclassified Haladaptatus]